MQYVNLGKTGLKVSRLCLGMMTYGSKTWREWILTEEEAKPFVKKALDAGINFFDTADIYSLGESEKNHRQCPPSLWREAAECNRRHQGAWAVKRRRQ
ncbi:MAG: hypothetical protein OHK003_07830 [Anaerolineales bacterium]